MDKAIRRIKELRPDVVITMCIYRGEQRVVEEVKDLVEAIEPSPLSPEPVSSEDLPGHGAQLTI